MTTSDLAALLPLIAVGAAAVMAMLAAAFRRDHRVAVVLTVAGLALALATLPVAGFEGGRFVTSLLVIDPFGLFFNGLIFAAGIAVALLSYGYLERQREHREEFYVLLLLATFGSAVLALSNHFASFFLGLEILSVSLYAMIAYPRGREESVEAGLKYLVLAGASSAFLLFGIALTYAELGTLEFVALPPQALSGGRPAVLWLAGAALLVVGIGFKLAVVPFHLWTPDVYQGAPAPATAFVATVSKGAVVALLVRYFTLVNLQQFDSLLLAFGLIALASMLLGNLLALLQNNVKRLLAYSSIAHLGYILVAFLASGSLGATAVAFYLVAYFVTTLAAFGVVAVLSGRDRDAEDLEDYRGLFWSRPWLAGLFAASLLSLAGMPLTAGFVGKFYVALAGIGSGLLLLVLALVVGSAIGAFYYLRVVVTLYSRPAGGAPAPAAPSLSWAGGLALAILALLLVAIGVYPVPVIGLIQGVVGG